MGAINFHFFPCSSNKAASSLSSLLVQKAREAEKVVEVALLAESGLPGGFTAMPPSPSEADTVVEVALLVTSPAVFGSDTSVEETL